MDHVRVLAFNNMVVEVVMGVLLFFHIRTCTPIELKTKSNQKVYI